MSARVAALALLAGSLAAAPALAGDWKPVYESHGKSRPPVDAEEPKEAAPARSEAAPVESDYDTPVTVVVPPKGVPLPGLTWKSGNAKSWSGSGSSFVLLEGRFSAPVQRLYYGLERVTVGADGRFHLKVPMRSKSERIVIRVLDHSFKFAQAEYDVGYPEFGAGGSSHGTDLPFRFIPELGLSLLGYEESAISKFSQTSLVGGFSLEVRKARWSLDLGFSASLLNLSASDPTNSARFLGGALVVGIPVTALREPWSLILSGGACYSQVVGAGAGFGYQPLLAPQIRALLGRKLGNADSVALRLRYAPLSASIIPVSFSELETGISLSWRHATGPRHAWRLELEQVNLSLNPQDNVQVNSSGLGLSFGFEL